MLKCNLTQEKLLHIIGDSNITLRDGAENMIQHLQMANVPLTVFSAGIADVIREVLKRKSLLLENMKIFSNNMDFDSEVRYSPKPQLRRSVYSISSEM